VGARGPEKGTKYRKTLEKEQMRQRFRARVSARLDPLIDAELDAALGVTHLLAQGPDGKWLQVTDPAIMVAVLNGDGFYKITAQNPNVYALKDIFDRTMDKPTESVEVSGKDGEPIELIWKG
jgi:hypothetical protein